MRRFDGKSHQQSERTSEREVTLQLSQRQNIDDSIAKRFISPLAEKEFNPLQLKLHSEHCQLYTIP